MRFLVTELALMIPGQGCACGFPTPATRRWQYPAGKTGQVIQLSRDLVNHERRVAASQERPVLTGKALRQDAMLRTFKAVYGPVDGEE